MLSCLLDLDENSALDDNFAGDEYMRYLASHYVRHIAV